MDTKLINNISYLITDKAVLCALVFSLYHCFVSCKCREAEKVRLNVGKSVF